MAVVRMAVVKMAEVPYLKTQFSDIDVFVFPIKVKDLLSIQYVAARQAVTEQNPTITN